MNKKEFKKIGRNPLWTKVDKLKGRQVLKITRKEVEKAGLSVSSFQKYLLKEFNVETKTISNGWVVLKK